MFTLLLFLFILGILIIVHEFGHFIAAKKIGVLVEKFSLGFGPQLLKKKKGPTEYSISAIPLGGYVKLAGDNLEEYQGKGEEYLFQSPGKRFQIVFCGPLLNYILGFLCFWFIFVIGYPSLTTEVGGLLDDFGAKRAGLAVGDRIVAVDGKNVAFWEDLQKQIRNKRTTDTVRLTVARDKKEFTADVSLRQKQLEDELGQKRSVGLLGITPSGDFINVRYGIFKGFFMAAGKTWELTVMTYKGLWRMITGQLSVRESVTGPLGIFYITSKVASIGLNAVLHLVAVLSVSLAIFNTLPLPVLDGGHIFLLGIEKIRGRSLSLRVDRIITQIGLTIIVSIAILVTYNDILRFFGDKISGFFK